jgi:hypothetical protein
MNCVALISLYEPQVDNLSELGDFYNSLAHQLPHEHLC